jgi:DNA repair exonuclease SbcCD ATPase subunit
VQDRRVTELAAQVKTLHAIDIDAEIAVFDQIDQWHVRKREQDTHRESIERQIEAIAHEIARHEKDMTRYIEQPSDNAEVIRLTKQAKLYLTEADQDIRSQIDRLRSEVVRFQQQAASKYAEANQLAVELIEVGDRLAKPDAHHCATCGQGLAGTDHLAKVIANLARQQTHLTEKITHLLAEHEQAKRDAEVAEADIGQLAAADKAHRDDLRAKAAEVQAEIAAVQTMQEARQTEARRQIEHLDAEIAELRQERAGLTAKLHALPDLEGAPVSKYKNRDMVWLLRNERDQLLTQLEGELHRANPFEDKIEALCSTLVVIDYTMLNDLNNCYKHETFLHKLLTAKDSFIRKRIIDQNLSYLNKRLDDYLQRLGLPHEVTFIADLSVEISLLGASFDFEQLSRGEQNRVVLATAWAFGDVWQNLNTTLGLLFLDEMLDQGTDGAGVEAAMDILATMAADHHRSVFLISHREELRDRIDNVMVVRKESHFTSFA